MSKLFPEAAKKAGPLFPSGANENDETFKLTVREKLVISRKLADFADMIARKRKRPDANKISELVREIESIIAD